MQWLALPRSFHDDPSSGYALSSSYNDFKFTTLTSARPSTVLPRLQVQLLRTYYCLRLLWLLANLFLEGLIVAHMDVSGEGRNLDAFFCPILGQSKPNGDLQRPDESFGIMHGEALPWLFAGEIELTNMFAAGLECKFHDCLSCHIWPRSPYHYP